MNIVKYSKILPPANEHSKNLMDEQLKYNYANSGKLMPSGETFIEQNAILPSSVPVGSAIAITIALS